MEKMIMIARVKVYNNLSFTYIEKRISVSTEILLLYRTEFAEEKSTVKNLVFSVRKYLLNNVQNVEVSDTTKAKYQHFN